MNSVIDWLTNPLIQSMVISPLIGAIIGLLLSGGGNSITGDVSIHQSTINFINEIRVEKANQNNGSVDGISLLILCAFIIATVLWGYSRYAVTIIDIWINVTFFSLSFILSAGIATYIRNQFLNNEWIIHIFAPFLFGVFSLYLTMLAKKGIILGAAEATYKVNIVDYYFKVLNEEQKIWLIFQIFGVLSGAISSIGVSLVSLFYLSLLNQAIPGRFQTIWFRLARYTSFFSQFKGAIFLLVMILLSYLFLSGEAYKFYIRS